jgi:general secretion pathway protein D
MMMLSMDKFPFTIPSAFRIWAALAILVLTLPALQAQNSPRPPSAPPPGPPPTMPDFLKDNSLEQRLQQQASQLNDFQPGQPTATRPNPRPATARPTNQVEAQAESGPIFEEDDPRMRELVGLIRIPDMGTNEILEMLENFTGKPILRQQTLPNVKITFFSQEAMTRGEAIRAIESLLALNGIAITPLGEQFLKAVPANIINAQGAPVWDGSTLDAIPSQKIYEKLFQLDFLSPQEAVQMIQPLMSQGSPISFEKSGLILISDALVNLQRIEEILSIIDRPAALTTEILFFPLDNLDAEELIRKLDLISKGPLKRQLEGNTSFEADERTNQLIVFTHPSNAELVTSLVERLDIDVAPLTETKVYNIRYADASEVVSIIEQVVTGQKELREAANNANAAAAARRRVDTQKANAAAAAARQEAGNLQFSDFLTIVPDERANTIVASGTANDLRYLESLIDQIDSLLAQVRIEVVITEVRLQKTDTRGIDTFGFSYSGPYDMDNGTKTINPGSFYGATINPITFGNGEIDMSFILNAAKTKGNVSVLSAPTIVTTHNKEATVSVGEERPVLVGQTSSGTNTTLVTNNIQFKDVKLELKVTPLIGADGVIQMEIDQSNQSIIGDVEIDNVNRPIIGTRKATSFVSVRDGELVVLGGLQALDTNQNENRMAIFGSLPIVGDLFKSNSDDQVRTELLIFIRPTIVRTTTQANADAERMVNVIESSEDVQRYLDTGTFRNEGSSDGEEEREIPRRFQP